MSERCFKNALLQCRLALRAHKIEYKQSSRRTFSSSNCRSRQGPLPDFSITPDNTNLTELLSTLRRTIFLPSALNTPQRKLIYRTRHHAMLLSDPVVVEIGDEQHTLAPLDITKDVPDSWKSVQKAMELMGDSRADWRNLTQLLVAMRKAGRKWKDWQWERIVRRAGNAGMVEEVLEAVRQTQATGLVLGDLRLVREVMWACRERAVKSGWAAGATNRALRCAEQLAEMLEEDVHTARYVKGRDPRVQSEVLGVVVELAAIKAQKHGGGEDKDGKVKLYVKRLIPNLGEIRALDLSSGEGLLAARADYELLKWLPVKEALRISERVLGDNMPQADVAGPRLEELARLCNDAADLVEAADESGKDKRKGLKWFRELNSRTL